MVGLLEGQIASAIYKGFKDKLLKGTLRRLAADAATGLDKLGDPINIEKTDYACQGFVDEYSEFMRAQAGIPDTDLKVCIFAKSLPASIKPQLDDLVQFKSIWYQLKSPIGTDPAIALWICRASKVQGEIDDCRARGQ